MPDSEKSTDKKPVERPQIATSPMIGISVLLMTLILGGFLYLEVTNSLPAFLGGILEPPEKITDADREEFAQKELEKEAALKKQVVMHPSFHDDFFIRYPEGWIEADARTTQSYTLNEEGQVEALFYDLDKPTSFISITNHELARTDTTADFLSQRYRPFESNYLQFSSSRLKHKNYTVLKTQYSTDTEAEGMVTITEYHFPLIDMETNVRTIYTVTHRCNYFDEKLMKNVLEDLQFHQDLQPIPADLI